MCQRRRSLLRSQRFGGFRVSREVTDKADVAKEIIPVRGATPAGASDRDSAARAVREMFTAIAPRYDLLNHLLSANIDKLWWRRTARSFANVLEQPGVKVLDLCCGTGDMALALRRQAPQAEITGADFSHTMLVLASKKNSQPSRIKWVEADAL